jgi:hypothetical protein
VPRLRNCGDFQFEFEFEFQVSEMWAIEALNLAVDPRRATSTQSGSPQSSSRMTRPSGVDDDDERDQ